MRVQGVGDWIGFRDVLEVDGRQVRDRQDRLAALFLGDTATALAQARRIAKESSRYNLGSTGRTVNVPTYALFYLHPVNTRRLRFEKEDEGCGDDDTAWVVGFEEVERPTLARGFENIDLPSRGRFCLDPVSGRVLETEFELHHPSAGRRRLATDAKVSVTFALEPRLNLWVPAQMRETYSERGGGSTRATARYRKLPAVQRDGQRIRRRGHGADRAEVTSTRITALTPGARTQKYCCRCSVVAPASSRSSGTRCHRYRSPPPHTVVRRPHRSPGIRSQATPG